MEPKSIILVGGPDSGKSNFLAGLWLAFQSKKYKLLSKTPPANLIYIEGISDHLLSGKFVPRTKPEEENRDFTATIYSSDDPESITNLVVPDMYGEIWKKAVKTLDIPKKWLETLRQADGAILFVRIQSENNVDPLNWVTTQPLIKSGLVENKQSDEIPTQVNLIELLRFLEENLNHKNGKPKVALIVTAWDLLHADESKKGPFEYLKKQFPLLYGRIHDIDKLNIKIFGCSVVGGDFSSESFTQAYLEDSGDDCGYIVQMDDEGEITKTEDITIPIQWLVNKQ